MKYEVVQNFDLGDGVDWSKNRRSWGFPVYLAINAGFVVPWPEGKETPKDRKHIRAVLDNFYRHSRRYKIETASGESGMRVKRIA